MDFMLGRYLIWIQRLLGLFWNIGWELVKIAQMIWASHFFKINSVIMMISLSRECNFWLDSMIFLHVQGSERISRIQLEPLRLRILAGFSPTSVGPFLYLYLRSIGRICKGQGLLTFRFVGRSSFSERRSRFGQSRIIPHSWWTDCIGKRLAWLVPVFVPRVHIYK